jgi:uncharacterized lipoprotein
MNKLLVLLSAAIFFCGCTTSEERLKHKRKYDKRKASIYVIKCEMPGSREVKSYNVNYNNMVSPSNHRGGIWSFTTLNKKLVRSSICHVEE